jgi:hypothetical protein
MIDTWDDPVRGRPLIEMVTAAIEDPDFATLVREYTERELIDLQADRLGGRYPRRRAAVLTSQLLGMIVCRHIIKIEPIASMSADELVSAMTPAIQSTIIADTRHRS